MSGLFSGTPLERPVTCEQCEKPLDACACPRDASGAVVTPQDQPARVRREKRRGAWTTVVTGLDPHATDMGALARSLRKALATGGSATKQGEIVLQGDHRDAVVQRLREAGYPAKASGG